MKTWPVQDAKARFSELIETCLREGRKSSRDADWKRQYSFQRHSGVDSSPPNSRR